MRSRANAGVFQISLSIIFNVELVLWIRFPDRVHKASGGIQQGTNSGYRGGSRHSGEVTSTFEPSARPEARELTQEEGPSSVYLRSRPT